MERVEFPSRRGNRLVGILHPPSARAAEAAGVILCHGMESTKEGTKHRMLGERLSAAGLWVLRFDFSYVGESEGEFADLTFRGEVEDLAGAWKLFRSRCPGPVALLGSSMGGTVALLFAAEEPGVTALALIAAVARPQRILAELRPGEIDRWRRDGVVSLGGVRLKRSFLDDVEALDVLDAASRVRCPTFIAHGDADGVVPVSDATDIEAALGGEKRCKIYPGADHRFSKEEDLEELLGDCERWLRERLGGAR
ncbi:MAG: alpha/beta hydrolase [Candidatus Binatia bacterium]